MKMLIQTTFVLGGGKKNLFKWGLVGEYFPEHLSLHISQSGMEDLFLKN
jgi:hypothetical protein